METFFAPAKRTERRQFRNQVEAVSQSPLMNTLLQTMAGLLVVLNEDRQIVALNHVFLDALGIHNPEEVLGLRLGESLHCIHAFEEPGGCGTSQSCSTCGAVIAMMIAMQNDSPCERTCALTTETDGVRRDICLRVRATPLSVEMQRWIVVCAQDISQELYRANLENVFFHDINNIITALLGASSLLAKNLHSLQEVEQIHKTAIRLANEMALQRVLAQGMSAQYSPQAVPVSLEKIRSETNLILYGHKALQGKTIHEVRAAGDCTINTDVMLVSRILGNMLLNALEATPEGGEITFTTRIDGAVTTWEVWNEAYIPEDIQMRIFQRHFSTKTGSGRGFGTYSMKLFAEHYLNGKIAFASTMDGGTVFSLRLPRF
jgi:signal transduction histidine kinase